MYPLTPRDVGTKIPLGLFLKIPFPVWMGSILLKWDRLFENLIHKMLTIVENFAQPLERVFSRASQAKLTVAGFIGSTTPEYIFQ